MRRPSATIWRTKTLGIAGFGEIGAALARRAQASRHEGRLPQPQAAAGRRGARRPLLDFDELLATADCVVALVPLSPQTRKMFGAAQFAKMKPAAHFVNVGRGALTDTEALLEALRSGKIAGAALDVTDPEPLPPEHPLYGAPNITIYPHIGSATPETRERMADARGAQPRRRPARRADADAGERRGAFG